jgi:hypothetical protein
MNQEEIMQSKTDHDLLIILNENVTHMRDEMKQNNQIMSAQATDFEARLRVLEANTNIFSGARGGTKYLVGMLLVVAGLIEPVVFYLVSK